MAAPAARAAGAGPDERVALALVQAGWHTPQERAAPAGRRRGSRPAHAPALQPAARLWPLCEAGVANTPFAALANRGDAVAQRLVTRSDEVVRRLAPYHGWPQTA